jgi:hypothetical protein
MTISNVTAWSGSLSCYLATTPVGGGCCGYAATAAMYSRVSDGLWNTSRQLEQSSNIPLPQEL